MTRKNVWFAGLATPVMITMLLLAGSTSVTANDQPSAAPPAVKIDNFSFGLGLFVSIKQRLEGRRFTA